MAEYKLLIAETTKKKNVRSSGGTRLRAVTLHSGVQARQDIGFFVRSKWEANYVRILRFLNTKFEYEKYEFKFPVERGTMFYLPDFYLPDKDKFIELKGHLDQKSRTQLSRFLQYYPDKAKRMRIVIRKLFDSKAHLTKEAAMLMKLGYDVEQILEYEAWVRQFCGAIEHWEN